MDTVSKKADPLRASGNLNKTGTPQPGGGSFPAKVPKVSRGNVPFRACTKARTSPRCLCWRFLSRMYKVVVTRMTNAAAMLQTRMTTTWPEVVALALRDWSEAKSGAFDVEPTVRQP